MTAILAREVDAVQNPALAAVLLWRFCVGYAAQREDRATTPLPVLFISLAILFNEEALSLLNSTRKKSGLHHFAGKFTDSSIARTDVLLSLEQRAKALRGQTLEALRLSLHGRLLFLKPDTAEVFALSQSEPKSLPESVQSLVRNAEKLGGWCGAVSMFELGVLLHVTF
jgi:hypothetical protein